MVALVQVFCFALCLTLGRMLVAPWPVLWGFWPWGFVYLLLVTFAAVGLGLLISSTAVWLKRREAASVAASVLVALVMMWQILFSVQVAGTGGKNLHEAYRHFHLGRRRDKEG